MNGNDDINSDLLVKSAEMICSLTVLDTHGVIEDFMMELDIYNV